MIITENTAWHNKKINPTVNKRGTIFIRAGCASGLFIALCSQINNGIKDTGMILFSFQLKTINKGESKMKKVSVMFFLLMFIFISLPVSASTLCPDGTYVAGDTCTLAPNGRYVGGEGSTLAPDGSYVGGRQGSRLAPDGSYVGGSGQMHLCPDGSYVNGNCRLTPNGKYVGE
jgi:hypothetical protein